MHCRAWRKTRSRILATAFLSWRWPRKSSAGDECISTGFGAFDGGAEIDAAVDFDVIVEPHLRAPGECLLNFGQYLRNSCFTNLSSN
jgi:hypothetical protein